MVDFNFGSSKTVYKMDVKGDGKDVKMLIGDKAIESSTDTAVQTVIRAAGNTAGKVIEGSGTIVTPPAVWLKDIQENWLLYVIMAAIILSIITFFYCTICSYLRRKNNSSHSLGELVKVISERSGVLNQLPLSPFRLPAPVENTSSEIRNQNTN